MSALFGARVDLASVLPPDARQGDFSRSLTQSVDASTLRQLDGAARALTLGPTFAELAVPPCVRQGPTPAEPCLTAVVRGLALAALRREPTEPELSGLVAVFQAGANGAEFRDGLALVVRALLGSAGHLYDTALGDPARGERAFQLSDEELGNQLAWLLSGQPPDSELARAARAGELQRSEARREQARRLLAEPAARLLLRRFVEEWLGLSRLRGLAKSTAVIADFRSIQPSLLEETGAVVDDLLVAGGGSLRALFAGGYTFLPGEVPALYGVQPAGVGQRVSLSGLGRVGLLQHGSFLATFAHEDSSAPVLRGKAVLERLLCRTLPKPAELGIDLTLPPFDPTATTRERFANHAETACAGCHDAIDGVGFTFENFDAVGRSRVVEAGSPVDTSGHVTLGGRRVPVRDSVELAQALAASEELESCAARHVVRFAAGTEDSRVEDDFVEYTRELPSVERSTLTGLFLAYVASDWFTRMAP
jgi:hypothetical protein